jgi:hypothetical protein
MALLPLGLLLPAFLAVAVAPVFAWRGQAGPIHWYTQVTRYSRAGSGVTGVESRGSRGWVLRLGDWHWFLSLDQSAVPARPSLHAGMIDP